MGKQARHERRQLERARRSAGPAAEVADRAERGLATLIDGITDIAAAKGRRVHRVKVAGFAQVRQRFLDRGYRWPSWCYLPVPFVGATLGEEIAIDLNPWFVSPATLLAALAGAWVPGRIAVRFDPDLAAALMDTPLESSIPIEALHRLPAWCLYLDIPELVPGGGVFVALDPGNLRVPGQPACDDPDELLVAIVRDGPGPRLIMSSVWLLPGLSIAESLARQDVQRSEYGAGMLEVEEDDWAAVFGMSRRDVLARLLSLVLYLCSAEPDTMQTGVPARVGHGRPSARDRVTVMSTGFRIGAALRSGRGSDGSHTAEGTGRRVRPHLRSSHWHHYWCGSEERGDRRLELRWIPPVPVNADLSEELLTVVRPASAGSRSDPPRLLEPGHLSPAGWADARALG